MGQRVNGIDQGYNIPNQVAVTKLEDNNRVLMFRVPAFKSGGIFKLAPNSLSPVTSLPRCTLPSISHLLPPSIHPDMSHYYPLQCLNGNFDHTMACFTEQPEAELPSATVSWLAEPNDHSYGYVVYTDRRPQSSM